MHCVVRIYTRPGGGVRGEVQELQSSGVEFENCRATDVTTYTVYVLMTHTHTHTHTQTHTYHGLLIICTRMHTIIP